MNIMFLNGAGGTGKSSLLAELAKLRSEDKGLFTLSSSTRQSYAQLGISGETDSLTLDDATRIKLQLTIMENERVAIKNAVEGISANPTRNGYELLIVDRGPMDRMAYYLLTMMECNRGNLDPWHEMLADTKAFLAGLKMDNIIQVDFTYPVPWPTADSFRHQNQFQTLGLSLMTSSILQRYAGSKDYRTVYWYDHEFKQGSPASRAKQIFGRYINLFPFGPDYSWV